jgi:hypothetical protein
MAFFRRPDYSSDTTEFIAQLKSEEPTLEARQRAGRARLWDTHPDRAEQAEYSAARVPQAAYVYATQPPEPVDA